MVDVIVGITSAIEAPATHSKLQRALLQKLTAYRLACIVGLFELLVPLAGKIDADNIDLLIQVPPPPPCSEAARMPSDRIPSGGRCMPRAVCARAACIQGLSAALAAAAAVSAVVHLTALLVLLLLSRAASVNLVVVCCPLFAARGLAARAAVRCLLSCLSCARGLFSRPPPP
jgi:hypothetical protein